MPLPEQLVQPLTSLVVGLINLQSPPNSPYGKRYYSALFRELPARDVYMDYYLIIKEPRSLNGVMDSMKKGIYSSPAAVAYDLFLIWSNAREYNQQGSMVYGDADVLEAKMRELWNLRSPPLPPWHALLRPEDLNPKARPPPPPPVATPVPAEPKIKKIKLMSTYSASPAPPPPQQRQSYHQPLASTSAGTPAPARATPHLRLAGPAPSTPAPPTPAPSTPSNPPLTLKLALKPPAPPTAGPSYASASPVAPPAAASPYHTYGETSKEKKRERDTTPAGAEKLKSERKKEKKAREKAEKKARERAEREKAEVEAPPLPPGIPDVESGWMSGDIGPNPIGVYLEIIRKLRDHTDASGRPLATPFLTIPDPTSRPDYHELVENPIALDTIENKARNGLYGTPEAFDRDLFHLFSIGKMFIRPDSPGHVYSDLVVLQRLYHELTKRRSAFDLPTPTSGSLASSTVGPGNPSIKNEDGSFTEASGISSRLPMKDRTLLESINFKGQVFRVGDWVHLLNPDAPHRPIVAQIWRTYKRVDSAQRCFGVCWYMRPEETIHPGSRQFYENEVFKTNQYTDYAVEDFVERCMVMFHARYVRGRPKPPVWTPGMPLYVCEHRYKDQVFKKIKNWPLCLPDEVRRRRDEYDFEEFPDGRVEQPPRVRSPFVRGVEGPGRIGEEAVGQDSEQAKYHFLPGGEPVTPSAMKEAERKAEQQRQELAAVLAVQQQQAAAQSAAAHQQQPRYTHDYGTPSVAPSTPFTITLQRPELGAHSASASYLQSAAPILPPQPAGPPPGATPAEIAVLTESFSALPAGLKSKFRSDAMGDMLWFTAPAAAVPVVSKPSHSLDYLYWRAMQKKGAAAPVVAMVNGGGGVEEDVEMTDA